jgi:hypothetical protein
MDKVNLDMDNLNLDTDKLNLDMDNLTIDYFKNKTRLKNLKLWSVINRHFAILKTYHNL